MQRGAPLGNSGEPAAERPRGAGRAGKHRGRRPAADRDHAIEISVADDGPGIAPDKIERIFEAYFTTKEKGTGLGLAIVKHNVELYGGTVRVDSALGKGAKFTVIFPAKSLPKPFLK